MGKLLFEAFIVYIIIQVIFFLIKSNSAPKKVNNTVFNNGANKPKSTNKKDDGDFVDYEEIK